MKKIIQQLIINYLIDRCNGVFKTDVIVVRAFSRQYYDELFKED